MTLTERLDALNRLREKATKGPWATHQIGRVFVGSGSSEKLYHIVYSTENLHGLNPEAAAIVKANAAFIAAAHEAVDLCNAYAERLAGVEKRNEELRSAAIEIQCWLSWLLLHDDAPTEEELKHIEVSQGWVREVLEEKGAAIEQEKP